MNKTTIHTKNGTHTFGSTSKELEEMQLKAGVDAINAANEYKHYPPYAHFWHAVVHIVLTVLIIGIIGVVITMGLINAIYFK